MKKPGDTKPNPTPKEKKGVSVNFGWTTTIHTEFEAKGPERIRKQPRLFCSMFRVQRFPSEALEIQTHEVAESWGHF